MSLPHTTILASLVDRHLMMAVSCPSWCAEPTGHGTTDAEIMHWGELFRLHQSAERVLVRRPFHGAGPLTGRLSRGGQVSLRDPGNVWVEPAVVMVDGVPDCGLTAAEARELAAGLVTLADVLEQG